MDDAALKISKRGLLQEALEKLHIQECSTIPVRDNYGIIGYEIATHILVAKPMFYKGTMVSCHTDVANRAISKGKKILFYIGDYNSFYEFDARQVFFAAERNHRIKYVNNKREQIPMLNFRVNMGQKVSIFCLMEKQLTLF